jgi:putative hydrolase of HD superfamily
LISKGPFPPASLEGKTVPPLIEAYFELNQLKRLFRQGWLRRGVPPERCESVAEHVFSMALLGWWICDSLFPALDRDRVLRMVLAHELGEIYTGDLIPADGVEREEKHRREHAALLKVAGKLAGGAAVISAWEEYEAEVTPEARFVRQLDRLEMAMQACVYEAGGFEQMGEFFRSAEQDISDAALREILQSLAALRKVNE